jgi:hypothetical protein
MSYNTDLLPLLISLLFLSIVVLWISVKNYRNFLITFFVIPLTLGSATVSYFTVDNLLGYPVMLEIPEESVYIMHVETKELIYVWLIPPGVVKPRAYAISNTEQNRDAMKQAQEASENGVPQQIRSLDGEQGQGQTVGGEYMTYDFQMPNIPGASKNQ